MNTRELRIFRAGMNSVLAALELFNEEPTESPMMGKSSQVLKITRKYKKKYKNHSSWTEDENEIVRQHKKEKISNWIHLLPGRTKYAAYYHMKVIEGKEGYHGKDKYEGLAKLGQLEK